MNRLIYLIFFLAIAGNVVFSVYSFSRKSNGKVAYIYIDKAYNEFKGKIEIERDLKQIENQQNGILDSVKFVITDLEAKMKVSTPQMKERLTVLLSENYSNLDRLTEAFDAYNAKESQKHIQSLLKQINQYVKDYGEENGYDFIYGANGNGSLMYANERNDITADIVKYINNQYEGKK